MAVQRWERLIDEAATILENFEWKWQRMINGPTVCFQLFSDADSFGSCSLIKADHIRETATKRRCDRAWRSWILSHAPFKGARFIWTALEAFMTAVVHTFFMSLYWVMWIISGLCPWFLSIVPFMHFRGRCSQVTLVSHTGCMLRCSLRIIVFSCVVFL